MATCQTDKQTDRHRGGVGGKRGGERERERGGGREKWEGRGKRKGWRVRELRCSIKTAARNSDNGDTRCQCHLCYRNSDIMTIQGVSVTCVIETVI